MGYAKQAQQNYCNIMGTLSIEVSITMSTQTSLSIESKPGEQQQRELCPRLTLETAHGGKIFIFTFSKKTRSDQTSSRLVIDTWVDTIKSYTCDLPAGSAWYRLTDFSQTDMNPSPYFVARLREISRYRPDLKGHSAFVIPRNLFTAAILNLSRRVRPKHVKVRLFFERGEALSWLESELQGAQTAKVQPLPTQTRIR
jgi:hypothetical protein